MRNACQRKGALSPYHCTYVMWQFQIWITCLVSLGLKREAGFAWKSGENHSPETIYALFSENCWNKILIILLIGLITSRCFWEWACMPVPKRRLVAWVIMGYHIIACLNQVESIIKYFSWRRFQRCFLMWHAIELQCRAF